MTPAVAKASGSQRSRRVRMSSTNAASIAAYSAQRPVTTSAWSADSAHDADSRDHPHSATRLPKASAGTSRGLSGATAAPASARASIATVMGPQTVRS